MFLTKNSFSKKKKLKNIINDSKQWILFLENDTNELIYKTETDSQT